MGKGLYTSELNVALLSACTLYSVSELSSFHQHSRTYLALSLLPAPLLAIQISTAKKHVKKPKSLPYSKPVLGFPGGLARPQTVHLIPQGGAPRGKPKQVPLTTKVS